MSRSGMFLDAVGRTLLTVMRNSLAFAEKLAPIIDFFRAWVRQRVSAASTAGIEGEWSICRWLSGGVETVKERDACPHAPRASQVSHEL